MTDEYGHSFSYLNGREVLDSGERKSGAARCARGGGNGERIDVAGAARLAISLQAMYIRRPSPRCAAQRLLSAAHESGPPRKSTTAAESSTASHPCGLN